MLIHNLRWLLNASTVFCLFFYLVLYVKIILIRFRTPSQQFTPTLIPYQWVLLIFIDIGNKEIGKERVDILISIEGETFHSYCKWLIVSTPWKKHCQNTLDTFNDLLLPFVFWEYNNNNNNNDLEQLIML